MTADIGSTTSAMALRNKHIILNRTAAIQDDATMLTLQLVSSTRDITISVTVLDNHA